MRLVCVVAALAAAVAALHAGEDAGAPERAESKYLRNIRPITFDGAKNGEAYFSPDMKQIIFQGVREPGNPFYQIYTMQLDTGATRRVSTGKGKTTCAWFHPKKPRLLFASTHLDSTSETKQAEEIKRQKEGPARRYSWDFDDQFDLFETDLDGGNPVRLTDAKGYDAEANYSPDGTRIVLCSFRDGDGEIYVMDADGKNPTRLTTEKGYDGGPFFSPDGKKIIWRHFNDAEQKVAEVWTMDADGSNKKQVTKLNSVSWAPFYHPSMEWIVFASNHEDPAFEVYAIRPDGSDLTRITDTNGFDGLPVISPDGSTLMWTSNRNESKSQLFLADLRMPSEKEWRIKPAFTRINISAQVSGENFEMRLRQIVGGAGAQQIEHAVGKGFMQNRLLPPVPNAEKLVADQIEETWYVQGPSVVGYMPARNGATTAIVLCAALKRDGSNREGVAALMECARIAYSFTVAKPDAPLPAVLAIAAQEDELPRSSEAAATLLAAISPNKDKPLTPAVLISLAGLSAQGSQRLNIAGVGSSSGWRRYVETLAARHPGVQLNLSDDPNAVPELAGASARSIPSIAFSSVPDLGEANEDPFALLDGGDGRLADRARGPQMSLQCAMDGVRLLLFQLQNLDLKFFAFDSAAAKAAAGAARRPYLGTVPEYGTPNIKGVKLKGVREASPALNAGVKEGDIIVGLAGKPIENVDDYLKVLESLRPDEETLIKIERGTESLELKIRPGAR